MRARAPGKLVLSGAYSVLREEPALVCAVDRYVVADSERRAIFEAPEVLAAFELLFPLGEKRPELPVFDAAALREDGRKIGLGSSAAIVVACLRSVAPGLSDDELFVLARRAHRVAQGGGSGIDVAAAVFGGTLSVRLRGDSLEYERVSLPSELVLECFAMPEAASTSDFVRQVFASEKTNPKSFESAFAAQCAGARAAADAVTSGSAPDFISALRTQYEALKALGEQAGVPIVTPSVEKLSELLASDECFLPAGAGGGDVTIFAATHASSEIFRKEATRHGLQLLDLSFGAEGATLMAPLSL